VSVSNLTDLMSEIPPMLTDHWL